MAKQRVLAVYFKMTDQMPSDCIHVEVHEMPHDQLTGFQYLLPGRYSGLFTWVATFTDAFNVPQAGYFHYCIICDIKCIKLFETFTRSA